MTNKIFSKRAISPVVATALLIVVAVVSVVGFQTWFGTFSSGVFSNTETQSDSRVGNTQIDSIIGSSAYFNNAGTENITVTQVKVDGVDCNITTNATRGISEFDISSCLANVTTQTPEVVIYTNDGIYSEKFYLKEPVSASNSTTPSSFTGTMVWNATYDSGDEDYSWGIAIDNSDNIYVLGEVTDGSSTNYYTIKYNGTNGEEIWNVTYDGGNYDFPGGIAVDISGNVYVTGVSNNGSIENMYTIKYDSNGNEIWNVSSNRYGFSCYAYAIAVDSSENVYITGEALTGSETNFYTIKYNSSGSEVWNISYNISSSDVSQGIVLDSIGNVYVSGYVTNGIDLDFFTIKYNGTNGEEIWNVTYDGGNDDVSSAIAIDTNDNLYVGGYSLPLGYYLIKYDNDGNLIWSNSDILGDAIYGITVDDNGYVYVTGRDINQNYYTVQYDSLGNHLINITYDGGSNDFPEGGIVVDSIGDVIVSGMSHDGVMGNILTIKYS